MGNLVDYIWTRFGAYLTRGRRDSAIFSFQPHYWWKCDFFHQFKGQQYQKFMLESIVWWQDITLRHKVRLKGKFGEVIWTIWTIWIKFVVLCQIVLPTLFLVLMRCFYMTLKANYDQTVPKLHVRINSLMKRHHI
jgi:hypothetical protein